MSGQELDPDDALFGVLEEIIIEVRDAHPRLENDAASADIAQAIWDAGWRPLADWEYGVSWLEEGDRVSVAVEDSWRAGAEVTRIRRGYPFPEEIFAVRRRCAGEWEAVPGD